MNETKGHQSLILSATNCSPIRSRLCRVAVALQFHATDKLIIGYVTTRATANCRSVGHPNNFRSQKLTGSILLGIPFHIRGGRAHVIEVDSLNLRGCREMLYKIAYPIENLDDFPQGLG